MNDENNTNKQAHSSREEVGCCVLLARRDMEREMLGSEAWWKAFYVLQKAESILS